MTIHKESPISTSDTTDARLRVRDKFIFLGDGKLYVRGTTYGTFRPAEDGSEYDQDVIDQDFAQFAQMAANGFNAVRTYTVPPHWLLDTVPAARPLRNGGPTSRHVKRAL